MRNPLIGSPTNYAGNGGCGGMVSMIAIFIVGAIWYFV